MATAEIGLAARARGVATHLVPRRTLESLAEAADFETFTRALARVGPALEPIGEPRDVFAVERAIADTARRHLSTLRRWQQRMPSLLDVFAAYHDRRSLRALLRGAAQGASPDQRVAGLLPTPSLPRGALDLLARQATPSDVIRHLIVWRHPDAHRLLPLVRPTQVDLFAVEIALNRGFAERATRVAARGDSTLREFVHLVIDLGNVQNALLLAGERRDVNPVELFAPGGRWFSFPAFMSVASTASPERALTVLGAILAKAPMLSWLPVATGDVVRLEREFLIAALVQLTRATRLEPLGSAPVLKVLLLIEAQSRDLRGLAWGAMLGTPVSLRRQQLLTPS